MYDVKTWATSYIIAQFKSTVEQPRAPPLYNGYWWTVHKLTLVATFFFPQGGYLVVERFNYNFVQRKRKRKRACLVLTFALQAAR